VIVHSGQTGLEGQEARAYHIFVEHHESIVYWLPWNKRGVNGDEYLPSTVTIKTRTLGMVLVAVVVAIASVLVVPIISTLD